MKTLHLPRFFISAMMLCVASTAFAQGNAFTYHGQLHDNGGPANGSYDLTFSVFDAPSMGNQIGNPLTNALVGVTNGLFTALLDFGPGVFAGPDRWLAMAVRTNGGGDFTLLTPRQRLTPTPYAIMANTASNLLGSLPAGQLSGTLADGQLSVNIPRLDGNATFTGTVNLNNPANSFSGSGSGLTGLNPTNLSPGTAAINISGSAATATSAATASTAITATTAATADSFSGLLAGDVTGNQAATVVASIGGQSAAQVASGANAANAATAANTPDTLVRRDSAGNFAAGAITSTSIRGDGSGLTALNASQLASGTLADGRLSANVGLLNAHQVFSGSNVFSGVVQLTNLDNTIAGTLRGSGTELTALNPANLLTGTAPISISGNAATATLATTAPWSGITEIPAGLADGVDNDTTYSAGVGLSLNGSEFNVDFAGSGTATQAARSDHNHAGEYAANTHPHSGDDITSGTLADARLSSNVALRDAHQAFNGSNTFHGVLNATNSGNTFNGSGSGLTGLNPTNLSAGTAAIDISGHAATATTATTASSATTATTAITAANFIGLLHGDVTGPQAATVVASIGGQSAASVASGASAANAATAANTPDTLVRRDGSGNFAAGVINSVSINGDGSGLTALNASQLVTGVLADERLSSNVALLSAHQTFSGSNDFSGVVQLSHTNNTFVGTFTGDGAGLSNLVVAAANLSAGIPASLLTGTLPANLLAGSYTNPVTFNNPANSFAGNGAGLSNVNAAALGGVGAASFWQLGGNAATIAGLDFLGTTDEQPLELKVNNTRALRLEPNLDGAPNIIGGAPLNFVAAGVMGATISGGGTASSMSRNSISSDFGTISGGSGNTIQNLEIASSELASIGGGQDNTIDGASRSVIAGGANNSIFSSQYSPARTNRNWDSIISGGSSNSIEAPFSTIGGGVQNLIRMEFTDSYPNTTNGTIAGGIGNTIWGSHSSIGGGRHNSISADAAYDGDGGDCTIGGGSFNQIRAYWDYICLGNTIAGGTSNSISDTAEYSSIGGGLENSIGYYAWLSVISGGRNNRIAEGPPCGIDTISGGINNYIWGSGSTIGGGSGNSITAHYATIPGGAANRTTGAYSVVPGGSSNTAGGDHSLAAGRRANATQTGSFVWADSTDLDYDPYSYPVPGGDPNSFNVRATGGLYFVTAVDGTTGQPTSGMYVSAGGSGWNTYSDRNAKTNFAAVDGREILRRLEGIPITSWNYKTQDPSKRHIGPMAQDFNAAFEVGEADKVGEKKHIHSLDMDGVALAAIQGLNEVVKEQKAELRQKAAEIQSLQKRLEVLERAVLGREMAQSGGGQ